MESCNKSSSGSNVTAASNQMPQTAECELKHQLLRQSKKVTTQGQGRPVYQVPLERNINIGGGRFHVLEMGKSPTDTEIRERVVLVIGATGAGKTTLINSLINYILGVDYKDEYRFNLVSETLNNNRSHPQTQHVSAYTLHHRDGFKIPYTLTIIDTPGFGDHHGGIQRDMEIAKELYAFFRSDNNIVDHIDAVGFVAPAFLARLTPMECYIFDSILSLFGKDIGENIFILLTFAGGRSPDTMWVIKRASIPHQAYFQFNNRPLFSDEDDEGDEGDLFNRVFWDMGMKSFQEFMKRIDKIKSKSLKLTRDVLEQRGRIELDLDELHKQVILGQNKQLQLKKEQEFLTTHDYNEIPDELKSRYEGVRGKRLSVQQIISAIKENIKDIGAQITYAVFEMHKDLCILQNTALRANHTSTLEYINILIMSERREFELGWEKRVSQLTNLQQRSELLVAISDDDFDPYKDYIEQARLSGSGFNDKEIWSALYRKFIPAFQAKFKDNQQCATQ